ncbi:MAG: hypothetical protein A2Z40_05445 [Deltaproteobacteria bacterium RBG_19FT_COMBO_60_16]|nr:MAG: hypothetical protein A2Z40_05445 [Deltaproteobacteria bacterium RBG_19FT_COMBO_60_16]
MKRTTTAWQAAVAKRAANDHRTARDPFPVVLTTGSAEGWRWLCACRTIHVRFRERKGGASAGRSLPVVLSIDRIGKQRKKATAPTCSAGRRMRREAGDFRESGK